MKMKAALMFGPNDIRVEEIEKPICPEGGMILKVMAVGLCGSDIRNFTTDSRKGNYPFVYGHEIVGIVDEVSPNLKGYKKGERLFLFPGTYCMKCDDCISGHSENCTYAEDLAGAGGFAQYVAVNAKKCELGGIYRIPEGVCFEDATLGEPLTSVFACMENINVGYPDKVVIIGAGPIGCMMATLAKIRGAQQIIIIDINAERLEKSLQFGADYVVDSSVEDPISAVMHLTEGRGANKVILANSSNFAQSQSIFMLDYGGVAVFYGGVAKGSLTELDANHIHYHNIWIKGQSRASYAQSKKAFELAVSGKFPTKQFITHRLPLEEINSGIQLTKSGEALKVIIFPNGMEPDKQ